MIPSWGSTHYLSTQNFRDDLFEKYKLDALLKEIQRNQRNTERSQYHPEGIQKTSEFQEQNVSR